MQNSHKLNVMLEIEKNIAICNKCGLCKTAKNPVPGEGNINSELVFVGEAPGATEDATGRPFVGRAGKLLESLLLKIGYKREDVWIGNIIKHRPPENRDPLSEEISACQPYLKLQLETIAPKLVITLGRFSMNYFYPDGKITRDHGTLRKIGQYYLFSVYHPAAALRNPTFLKTLQEDFAKIPRVLEAIRKRESEPTLTTEPDDSQLDLGL